MAENFMTHHSIRRKIINDEKNSSIKNRKNNISEKNDTSREENDSEVFFNFDNKKFIKSLNGMTKFFVALGSLDSRSQNFNDTKTNILHYVHIPNTVRTSTNQVSTKKIFSLKLFYVHLQTK